MRSSIRLALTLALALTLCSSGAFAQQYYGDPDDTPTGPIPSFSFLDRGHIPDRFGISLDYTRTPATQSAPFPGMFPATGNYRLELYGQHMTGAGFGGYLNAGLLVSRGLGGGVLASNPELGALWAPRSPLPMVVRAGISVGATGAADVTSHIFGSHARTTDFIAQTPSVTAARLSVSTLPRVERFYHRLDVGLDVPVREGDVDAHALARANVGFGVQTLEVAFAAELVNLIDLEAGDGGDRFRHTLGFSARYTLYSLQPSLAIGLPLSEPDRRYVSVLLIFGLEYVR